MILYFLFYNLVLTVLFPFFLVLLIPGFLLLPRLRPGFLSRFGAWNLIARLKGATLVHASSMGEINGLRSFFDLLEKNGIAFGISAFTDTGLGNAKKLYPARPVLPLAFDFPLFLLPLFLAGLKRIVVTEGEIWPNLIMMASLFKVPLFLVNARLTDRRFPGYLRLRPYYRMLFSRFDAILCQDGRSAENFKTLGVVANVRVTGSTKLDQAAPERVSRGVDLKKLNRSLGLGSATVILGGSLRGEEDRLLIGAMRNTLTRRRGVRLILVPRHLHRVPRIKKLLAGNGTPFSLYSDLAAGRGRPETVVVVDRLGVLRGLYRLSDIVFVGGTVEPVGGHNPVEPALEGNALIHGPSVDNNLAAFAALDGAAAAVKIRGPELGEELERLLDHPDRVASLKRRARAAILRCRGAGRRAYETIVSEG